MLEGDLNLTVGKFVLETGCFCLPSSGITAVFGHSGAGKSTFLKAIAGLAPRTKGRLIFNGQIWQQGKAFRPAAERSVGFVFQEPTLFPHLSVYANLLYALKRSPNPHSMSVEDTAERVGIGHQLHRDIGTLSGGESQRVAIARALLSQPNLLCMDEPLSALDWKAKGELLDLIEEVAQHTQLPILYVTHSPQEVTRLATQVVFMEHGKIKEPVSLKEALGRIDSPLFIDEGPVSILEGTLGELNTFGLRPLVSGKLTFWLTGCEKLPTGGKHRLRVLARDVSIALDNPLQTSILNHMPASVLSVDTVSQGRVLIRCALEEDQEIFAEITDWSRQKLGLKPGMHVYALVKSVSLARRF